MSCPVYQQLRNVCLPNIHIENTTTDLFYSLFNGSEQDVLRLAKYIYYAFIIRENRLKKFLELLHDTYLCTEKLSCRVISLYIF